jgi:hypothetical protein
VLEMGGKVAKKLGDGLMALFGYPVAQENDAERAARAALAIQRALAELMIDRHWDGIAAYCRLENKVSLGFVEEHSRWSRLGVSEKRPGPKTDDAMEVALRITGAAAPGPLP